MPATAEDLKIAVQDLGCVIASSRDEKYKQSLRDLQDRLAESARLLESPADEQLEELLTDLTGFSGDDFGKRQTVSLEEFAKARDRIRQLFRRSPQETPSGELDDNAANAWRWLVAHLDGFSRDIHRAVLQAMRESVYEQAASPSPSPASEEELPYDIEAISAKVHLNWMNAKVDAGVFSRKLESGEELMVPYSELSEQAKDLDRGTVKAVLAALTTKKETR